MNGELRRYEFVSLLKPSERSFHFDLNTRRLIRPDDSSEVLLKPTAYLLWELLELRNQAASPSDLFTAVWERRLQKPSGNVETVKEHTRLLRKALQDKPRPARTLFEIEERKHRKAPFSILVSDDDGYRLAVWSWRSTGVAPSEFERHILLTEEECDVMNHLDDHPKTSDYPPRVAALIEQELAIFEEQEALSNGWNFVYLYGCLTVAARWPGSW